MNILLYGINYTPELTGIGKYSGDMGAWLAERGHEVQVITGFPYYPNWEVQKPYRGRWWKTEQVRPRENIIRCPLYVPKQPSAMKRILHELSFLLSSSIALLACLFREVEVMVCVVTPFHLGIPARLFSWLKRVPMVYHVQDLQVDAARDLGMLHNKTLLNAMSATEKWILTQTDLVSSISAGMVKKIEAKGIERSKIHFFPNWVDVDFIRPLPANQSLRSALGFSPSDQIVLYSGNLGAKQGLETVIEVARQLRHIEDLHFVIVGEGGAKKDLIQRTENYQLLNIHFFPLQPFEELPALLAMADVHLVLQKKAAADLVMPSKLTSILAAGGCAVITAEEGSTLYEVTEAHQFGILVDAECPHALQKGIEHALQIDRGLYQSNARIYAETYLEKDAILSVFERQLLALVRSRQEEISMRKLPI